MEISLSATIRQRAGRGGAREARRAGDVPAVVYGACEPLSIACSARELAARMQDEAFRSSLLTLDVEGRKIPALMREVQMHPFKRDVLHIDFQAVSADQEIVANVPLRYVNAEESPGVKLHRAIFTTIENQVAIRCLPKDLPEFIEVNVGEMALGDSVHLNDVPAPAGIKFEATLRDENPALAIMSGQAAEEVDAPADGADAPAEGAAE